MKLLNVIGKAAFLLSAILILTMLSSRAAIALENKALLQSWYERAVSKDGTTFEEVAKGGGAPETIKWYSPIRIKLVGEANTPADMAALKKYLRDYVIALNEATNLTVAIVGEDSTIKPNVLLIIGTNVVSAVSSHKSEVSELFDDVDIDKKYLAPAKNKQLNCYFNLSFKDDVELFRGIVVVPLAEDLYATQKCLGIRLYQVMGMVGEPSDHDSVIFRDVAEIMPTSRDWTALSIHYLPGVESGVSINDIAQIVKESGVGNSTE